ncbi:MAG: aminotransferase [Caulobacteraceae bacterium]
MANPNFAALPDTIFDVMSGLARAHQAVNLGQGFPDDPGPAHVRAKAADAVLNGYNQYPAMTGLPELRQAVARHYERTQGLDLDWASQVTVTSGATEALAASFLALLSPGDEAVLFQPVYDSYAPIIRQAGAVPILARLEPPHFRWDRAMLEGLFSARTKVVALNNPLNPAAIVYGEEDLALLSEFCVRFDAVAVCDEVWEEVVFDGRAHRPLMAFPGMAERCVKIGSAGKMFGLTGWKVGFVAAAPALTRAVVKVHQFLCFTTPPNLQTAVAHGLDQPGDWFQTMRAGLERSRDRLMGALTREGFAVIPSQGTYFLNIDLPGSGIALPDHEFALRAVTEHGIATIPVSAFYEEDKVTSVLRLCFSKKDETLDEGVRRLAAARKALGR